MIQPAFFYDELVGRGTDFFAGVPDSLLKGLCAYVTDNTPAGRHLMAANEGCAVALAAGYHFATGRIPLVYMQNSGQGNAVNPLLSLADPDVYGVPMLVVIGWRGEPGVHDEPQHVKQGKVTCAVLEAMGIPYRVLSRHEDEVVRQLDDAYRTMSATGSPYALVVRRDTFADYKLQACMPMRARMSREAAIERVVLSSPARAAFVSTTGMASRELFELRERHGMGHRQDFLTVGSMGHASQIALAMALCKADRPIYCLDGDGACIMQMGGLATVGTCSPRNLVHIVLNNGAHDSVGGQPTAGLEIDIPAIAAACGYKRIYRTETQADLDSILSKIAQSFEDGTNGLTLVEVRVARGARGDLGRPTTSPQENKKALMEFLHD